MTRATLSLIALASSAVAVVALASVASMCAVPGTFVRNSATAWIWVAPSDQAQFVEELQGYAHQRSLRFKANAVPAPWRMIDVTILTPKKNKITIINATQFDKFNATITVFHPNEDWKLYWNDLRTYERARHKWLDDLKP
jgi:hypothetical protein